MKLSKMQYCKTRRLAPSGYIAIDKPSAAKAFDNGVIVTLCGNNVNSYHVFGGWALGISLDKARQDSYGNTFDSLCKDFLWALDRELGEYAVFYIKSGDYK